MLVCEACHPKIERGHDHDFEDHLMTVEDQQPLGLSLGQCELCRQRKGCVDCTWSNNKNTPDPLILMFDRMTITHRLVEIADDGTLETSYTDVKQFRDGLRQRLKHLGE